MCRRGARRAWIRWWRCVTSELSGDGSVWRAQFTIAGWRFETMSWWNFPARDKRDAELAREIDAHLEHETELNVARGMSREDARYAAKRKLGNETCVREDVYEMNTARWLDSLWQDVKYGA